MAEPLIVVLIDELANRARILHRKRRMELRSGAAARPRSLFRLSHVTEDGIEASNLLCGQRLIMCFGEPMAGWAVRAAPSGGFLANQRSDDGQIRTVQGSSWGLSLAIEIYGRTNNCCEC